ncbi:MAG TPA: TolC family protein [Rhodocyclaceae bacterium]|nr:TolC family protein [Rhodocyclaceae bacterium]
MKRTAVALVSLLALNLFVQPPVRAAERYTVDQLIAMALSSNALLGAVRTDIDISQAEAVIAGAYPNPEIEIMGGERTARGPALTPGSTQSFAFSQRLDYPSQREARREVASAGISIARASAQTFEVELVTRLKQGFYAVIRHESELRAAREDLDLAQAIRDRVEVRVQVGEAPRYELIRADTELQNAQKNADSAALRLAQAKLRLRSVVGSALPERFDVDGSLVEELKLPGIDQLRQRMLERNPELARLRAEVERSRRVLELENLRRMPDVSLKLARDRDPEYEAHRIGLAVSIPLFDRRQGQIAQAGALSERSRIALQGRIFELEQFLDAAYRQYELSRTQVAALESGIVRQAEAALRVAEAAYRFGERGILDVLDAQRVFRAARNELISARYELMSALAEIERISPAP